MAQIVKQGFRSQIPEAKGVWYLTANAWVPEPLGQLDLQMSYGLDSLNGGYIGII